MIKRFKDWLYRKYLPDAAKRGVWAENKALKAQLADLERQREVDVAKAYAAGMRDALRYVSRMKG